IVLLKKKITRYKTSCIPLKSFYHRMKRLPKRLLFWTKRLYRIFLSLTMNKSCLVYEREVVSLVMCVIFMHKRGGRVMYEFSDYFTIFTERYSDILAALLRHLLIAGTAIGLGCIIAIPLGIFL